MCTGNVKEGGFGYTDTLDALIVAYCRDFQRREESVKQGYCTGRTSMEYKFLNFRISEAAMEIAGERLGGIFIEEIGNRVGFAHSRIDCLSESAYKIQKQEIKLNIARKLHLLD